MKLPGWSAAGILFPGKLKMSAPAGTIDRPVYIDLCAAAEVAMGDHFCHQHRRDIYRFFGGSVSLIKVTQYE
jgi:hypothetical protein